MGASKKSHGKKEHKGTQSPVLKIFKDFQDPEKATLLKEKQKDKKRKYFRKTEQKTYDSSSTDRYKTKERNVDEKSEILHERRHIDSLESFRVSWQKRELNRNAMQQAREPGHGGVKETWWTLGGKAPKSADDTCSCVSCALKKVLASEYTCIACLLVLFSASVVGAFLLVFKSSAIETVKTDGGKKLQLIKRQLSDQKSSWDGPFGFSGVLGSDLAGTREETNTLEDVEGVSGDLISVLNREKIADSRHSEQLREFYKKLIETDAQIKKLKDSMFHNYQDNYERFRRSVTGKHSKLHKRRSRKKKNASSPADGVFVKEEKFVIKYGPIRRNYPKCDPHDEKQHESKFNHPFYKISQRFDEMLNKVDNNIKHDITTENEPKNEVTEVRGAHVYDKYAKDISFKARKLLQVVEEEDLGYEDMNKVLADDKHDDDIDQQLERLKRDESHNLPNVYNLNWKGPMLYPDEINAMIRDAALHNLQIPATKSNDKEYNSKRERQLSDQEYVQDYIDSKFDKLVGLAQAYSDYGVLDAKEKNTEKPFIDQRSIKSYGRSKKGFTSSSEGLRIEYRPGPANDNNFKKILEKHVKIVKPLPQVKPPKICNARMNIHFFTDNNKDIKLKPDSTVQAIEINPNADDKKKFEKDNPFKFKSRNLQSIDMSTDNVSIDNTKDVKIKPMVKTEDRKEKENLLESRTLQSMDTKNEEKTSLGLGEFMSLLADWFFKMADVSRPEAVNKSEVLLPTYDNDMVDNIGHRSRMLLQANVTDENITTSAAIVNTTINTTTIMPNTTKAIVKRSADFIFWNDIYDEDEYGAKMDYFDVTNKDNGVLIKSKNWLHDKVKVAADKIKYDFEKTVNSFTKVPKSPSRYDIPRNRPTRNTETNNEDFDVSKSFAKLNANLKHVCREAVDAVRSTRKVEAREDDSQATGLMQRLIKLMGDLVDIQVQQRTCTKLPADLRDFLEWLVAPDEQPSVDNLAVSGFTHSLSDGRYEKSPEAYDLSLTEDTHQEDRTECLGTIRAVQDLIQQYDGMSDDDKSKMAGVKEYLENQLQYLNRKLDKINEYEAINYRKRETRNKRNIHRRRRFFNKYLNFERKHTKTTIHTKMTKAKHANEINDKNVANDNVNDSLKGSLINNKNTRNLKDVYFKALDEAKKTTLKKI